MDEKELIKVSIGYQDGEMKGYHDVVYGNSFTGTTLKRFDVLVSEGFTKIILTLNEFEQLSSAYDTRLYQSMNVSTNLILKISYNLNEYIFKINELNDLQHRFMPLIGGFVVRFRTEGADSVQKIKNALDFEHIERLLPKEKTQ